MAERMGSARRVCEAQLMITASKKSGKERMRSRLPQPGRSENRGHTQFPLRNCVCRGFGRLLSLCLVFAAACTGDDLAEVPPTGAVRGHLCDPFSDTLAVGA